MSEWVNSRAVVTVSRHGAQELTPTDAARLSLCVIAGATHEFDVSNGPREFYDPAGNRRKGGTIHADVILKHANRHTTSHNSFLLHNSIYRRCEVGLGLFATILACPHHVPLRGNLEMPILRFCRFKALT